mmetsp:Transcript_54158/g.100017  ORF Transcript_54158/g.100017 Transcript_54158/m.100017 type:complete len:402 (+) Transcript_54158:110-1315(+)
MSATGAPPPEVDATMQAFSNWLTEMKARSNSSLTQMLSEMGMLRDGITSNSADLTEYKRHSVAVQQQMQSQLADLREKLAGALGEITSLVKQKASTDQELLSEINALQHQLSMKTSELEGLKKSYSQTHQQLQNSLIQLQGQLQATQGEILAAKQQAQAVQENAHMRMREVDKTLERLRGVLDKSGKEGNSQSLAIQEDISRLHEALTSLSSDFFDHKKVSLQVQGKLSSQVAVIEEDAKQLAEEVTLSGSSVKAPAAEEVVQVQTLPARTVEMVPPGAVPVQILRAAPGTVTPGSLMVAPGAAACASKMVAPSAPGSTMGSLVVAPAVPGSTTGSLVVAPAVPGSTTGSLVVAPAAPGTCPGSLVVAAPVSLGCLSPAAPPPLVPNMQAAPAIRVPAFGK